jgi:hypothetical protein
MCLRELSNRDSKWEFYVNPASSELPLMTAEEMARTLRETGDSIVDSFKNSNQGRHKKRVELQR